MCWFFIKVCVLRFFVFQRNAPLLFFKLFFFTVFPFIYLKFGINFISKVYLVNGSDENVKLKFSPRIIGGRNANKGEFLGIVSNTYCVTQFA